MSDEEKSTEELLQEALERLVNDPKFKGKVTVLPPGKKKKEE